MSDNREYRRFGFLLAAACAFVAFWPLLQWPPSANGYWIIAACMFLFAALCTPRWLAPAYKGWMVIGHALGWANARLLLGVVFFAVVTPIAIVRNLFGHHSLGREHKREGGYWIARDQPFSPRSFRDQF